MRPIHRVLAFALAFIVLVFPCCAKNPKAGTYFVDVNASNINPAKKRRTDID